MSLLRILVVVFPDLLKPEKTDSAFALVFFCLLKHICGVPWSEDNVKKRSHHDRHHVGHQPFMKASLLGTLSSRHLLCPSLHRSSDPKTDFFFQPGLMDAYVAGFENMNVQDVKEGDEGKKT